MRMTFAKIGAPSSGIGMHSERAMELLRAVLTSSMIFDKDAASVHMMKLEGDEKWRAMTGAYIVSWDETPSVSPSGEVEVRYSLAKYVDEEFRWDMLKDQVIPNVTRFVGLMRDFLIQRFSRREAEQWMKSQAGQAVFVFPAAGGDVRATYPEMRCFLYLLEKRGMGVSGGERLYGKDMVAKLVGKRANMMEEEAGKTLLAEVRRVVEEAQQRVHAGGSEDDGKAMIRKVLEDAAKALGVSTDSCEFEDTFRAATRYMRPVL